MKSRAIQAALKILLIREEYTLNEINEAISLIQREEISESLIKFLKDDHILSSRDVKSKQSKKNILEQSSKILNELKKEDYEKYLILSEFDSLIRKGLILKKLENIKTLAARLSKSFPDMKARRDAIPKIVVLLAELPKEKIKQVVEETLKEAKLSIDGSEYQELAKFLIQGSENKDIKKNSSPSPINES